MPTSGKYSLIRAKIKQKLSIIFLTALALLSSGCDPSPSSGKKQEKWIETVGKITEAEYVGKDQVMYTLVYFVDATKSKAVDQEGKKIAGDMTQHIMPPPKYKSLIPIVPQTVRVQFDPEEPMFWEYLEPIKWRSIRQTAAKDRVPSKNRM